MVTRLSKCQAAPLNKAGNTALGSHRIQTIKVLRMPEYLDGRDSLLGARWVVVSYSDGKRFPIYSQ